MQHCKKCLLLEAGERVTYDEMMRYVATLEPSALVDETTTNKRLEHCLHCDQLIAGMCKKCGCYVEVRARLKEKHCPDFGKNRW